MSFSISFTTPATAITASAFTDATFGAKAVALIKALVKTKAYFRQFKTYISNFTANGANNYVHYGGMFGADDCVRYNFRFASSNYTPTELHYDMRDIAECFYGITLSSSFAVLASAYSRTHDSSDLVSEWTAAKLTLTPSFWGVYYKDDNYELPSEHSKSSLHWCDSSHDTASEIIFMRRYLACKIVDNFNAIQQVRNLMAEICEKTPASQGGRGMSAGEYTSFASLASDFFMLQPAQIPRFRQALAWLVETQDEADYNPDGGALGWLADYLGDFYFSEYDPDYDTSWMEIADQTTDYGVYYNSAPRISDPLCVQGIGYVAVKTASGSWTRVIGIELARKTIIPSYNVASDYAEASNPNAFRANNGKANYKQSNVRQWANYEGSRTDTWKEAQHDYDAFFSGTSVSYLKLISPVLRANIAKTGHLVYTPKDTGAITNNTNTNANNRTLEMLEDRVWLPLLKNFGVTNTLSARSWTNFQLDMDPDIATVAGMSGKSNADYAENNWAWATSQSYRRKIQFNTNSGSTRIASQTSTFVPTRGAGTRSDSSGDNTIATHEACWYTNKPNGTGTYDGCGARVPYSYGGWLFCFTIVPFHAYLQNTALEKVKCNGIANLPYA